MKRTEIAVIGAGPAGLTAAIYARRAGREVLVLEKMVAGGQMLESQRIDNYPGVEQANGADLAATMRAQAVATGAKIELAEVTKIRKAPDGFELQTDEEKVAARAVIICTGVKARRMGVVGEAELVGRGVSFCTICDAPLYTEKVVGVYGGGNSALYSALELAKNCRKVYLIYRGEKLRAEAALVERARSLEKVEFLLNSKITKVVGDGQLKGVEIKGDELELDGLFVQIGRVAETDWCGDLMERDENGFIVTDVERRTKTPGLYAAGDVRVKGVRQITTAVADGAVAALAASREMD